MKYKSIEVRAARTQQLVLDGQCDVIQSCETIKEAKERAKYYLTVKFADLCEVYQTLGYSQVIADGECIADYFAPNS